MKIIARAIGRWTWIEPCPTDYPGFRVETMQLSREEYARAGDRYGLGGRKNQLEKGSHADIELMDRRVRAWEGEAPLFRVVLEKLEIPFDSFFVNGGVPCNKENKIKFLIELIQIQHEVDGDQTLETLWGVIQRRLQDQETIEAKNS